MHDIAIVGGGLVGALLARLLAPLNLKIIILDKAQASDLYQSNLDNRGLALAYSTKKILAQIGIWDSLVTNANAIQEIHVSQTNSFGFSKLRASDYKLEALGYVISAANLGRALIHGLEDLPITVARPIELQDAQFIDSNKAWELKLATETIHAKVVIAADGVNSLLRKVTGVGSVTKDFAQTAIVCNVTTDIAHTTTAFERFTEHGVLALLPFGKNTLKCIWTVSNQFAEELLQLDDLKFIEYVQNAIGYRAGTLTQVSKRMQFPIITNYIDVAVLENLFFLGNAANTLHPVAALGFNLAARDALALTEILAYAINSGLGIDSEYIRQTYTDIRSHEKAQAIFLSNNLVELFATNNKLVKIGRQLGIIATNFMPKFKQHVVASGIGQ